jgi:hypothetical protein
MRAGIGGLEEGLPPLRRKRLIDLKRAILLDPRGKRLRLSSC